MRRLAFILFIGAITVIALVLGSCSTYTCPTYAGTSYKNTLKQPNKNWDLKRSQYYRYASTKK